MAQPYHKTAGVEKIQQKTVVAQVMEKIRQLIASGQYRVHDRIPTEAQLAEMFGVGRSSIREAIKIFNYLGILESQAAKGTFVADSTNISTEAITWSILLGKHDLFELIDVRGALELWAVLSMQTRYRSDPGSLREPLDELERHMRLMHEAMQIPSLDRYVQSDFGFHNVILSFDGNSLFEAIYHLLSDFVRDAMAKTKRYGRSLRATYLEHEKIVELIKSGDTPGLVEITKSHFEHAKRSLSYLADR
jgi:DNA-binding FadR family transcriptional regulator